MGSVIGLIKPGIFYGESWNVPVSAGQEPLTVVE